MLVPPHATHDLLKHFIFSLAASLTIVTTITNSIVIRENHFFHCAQAKCSFPSLHLEDQMEHLGVLRKHASTGLIFILSQTLTM